LLSDLKPIFHSLQVQTGLDGISTEVGKLRASVSRMEREMRELRVEKELLCRVLSAIGASGEVHPQAAGKAPMPSAGGGGHGNGSTEERLYSDSRTPNPATERHPTGGGSQAIPKGPRPPTRKATGIPRAPVENVYSVHFLKEINSVAQAWRLFKSGLNG
jgi:hypothetical protein